MKHRVVTEKGRTPLLFIDIPSSDPNCNSTILAYSHLDKQPPMLPWAEGLDPYTPVIREEVDAHGKKITKLYGRGGADDGFVQFNYHLVLVIYCVFTNCTLISLSPDCFCQYHALLISFV